MSSAAPAALPCVHHPLPRAAQAHTALGTGQDSTGQLCRTVLPAAAQETCLSHRNPSARDMERSHPASHSALTRAGTTAHLSLPLSLQAVGNLQAQGHRQQRQGTQGTRHGTACQQPAFPLSSHPKGRRWPVGTLGSRAGLRLI